MDGKLTNVGGESREDVNNRFTKFITELLNNNKWHKVAIVSHGAAIKFFLCNYCLLNENLELVFNSKIITVESPSVIEIVYDGSKVEEINTIEIE